MKTFSAILVFFFSLSGFALKLTGTLDDNSNCLLLGKWKFIGYIYQGQFQPPPNPNLILTFEFLNDGTDILKWYRLNEAGFCERKGQYSYESEILSEVITWTNPENSVECNRDPDMMLGRKQVIPLRRADDQLKMDIPLGEQTLTYIWAPDKL